MGVFQGSFLDYVKAVWDLQVTIPDLLRNFLYLLRGRPWAPAGRNGRASDGVFYIGFSSLGDSPRAVPGLRRDLSRLRGVRGLGMDAGRKRGVAGGLPRELSRLSKGHVAFTGAAPNPLGNFVCL